MSKIVLLILTSYLLFAQNAPKDEGDSPTKTETKLIEQEEEQLKKNKILEYKAELKALEKEVNKEQVWTKSYSSYITSLEVRENLEKIKNRIDYLKKKGSSVSEKDELDALISKEKILASQIEKIKEKDSAPFSKLLTPSSIDVIPTITNPFDIFTGISLIKTLNTDFDDYIKRKKELTELIELIRKENKIYESIEALDIKKEYAQEVEYKKKQLERFETALDTITVTADVYRQRLEIIKLNTNKEVEGQLYRLVNIGIVILVVFIIFFLLKLIVKKYITDNERFYMANKIITFTNVTLVILILFFNYIENVSYLVTILGFASAGIAIAMKDLFMSILGWLVIVIGGSIHVGDRIKVNMEGLIYVGDVMDISLLRITLLEDITLTSVLENRRAGRIIFVPNNYIFTKMIANYTHSSLKTVWDGIKITITFDSYHKKAMHLCKEITKKYSKGYTDITRKQLNKLRN